jgi:MFS family permease
MGIAPQWFDKRRGLALGVATGGSGIGGLIMPFIMNPLLENLGAAWCYRVLGFLALAVGLFASIFIKERYPVQQHRKFSDLLDFSLLKQPNFVIWNIACDLCLLGYMVPFYLLPSKNSSTRGLEDPVCADG